MSSAPQPIQTQSPKWAIQAPDGKVIQFPDQFTDADVTREMTKMYPPPSVPTEAMAAAKPPVAPMPKVAMKTGSERNAEAVSQMGQMLASPVAPASAAASIPRAIGSLVGGYAGGKAGSLASNNPWARDIGAVVGGVLGAGTGAAAEDFGKHTLGPIEFPEKITLPGGFKLPWNRALPSEGTGAPLPAAGDFYESKAADLMRRGREQSALDVKAARAAKANAPTPELGTPGNPGWIVRLPGRMPKTNAPKQLPWQTGDSPDELTGQDIISRTRKITIPGEEPSAMDLKRAGDLTQAPVGRLQLLAKFGDKLAQNELNRRLKN